MYENLKILECRHHTFVAKFSSQMHSRLIKHYEIDYNLEGGRKITIDGRAHTVEAGSVIFRRPGQFCTSFGPYNMHLLTLSDQDSEPQIGYDPRNHLSCSSKIVDRFELPDIFIPEHGAEILSIYRRLSLLIAQPERRELRELYLDKLLHLLHADAVTDSLRRLEDETPVDRALAYIESHYSQSLPIELLAEQAHLSKYHFMRLFKQQTKHTPTEYIISVRLEHAKRLLTMTDMSVSDIGTHCGFENTSYFCRRFRLEFGVSPGEYRAVRRQECK